MLFFVIKKIINDFVSRTYIYIYIYAYVYFIINPKM